MGTVTRLRTLDDESIDNAARIDRLWNKLFTGLEGVIDRMETQKSLYMPEPTKCSFNSGPQDPFASICKDTTACECEETPGTARFYSCFRCSVVHASIASAESSEAAKLMVFMVLQLS